MKLLATIFLIIISLNAFSEELQAEFFFNDNVKVLNEGDVVSGTLRVWPIENPKAEEFTKFKNKNLFDGMYVSEIISSQPSENNADVFELKANFIIVNKLQPEKMVFTYNNTPVHVRYREVLYKAMEKPSNEFFILDQSVDRNLILNILIAIICLGGLFLGFKFRNSILKKFTKPKGIDLKTKYTKIFLEAKERQDFERIYLEKDIWTSLIEGITPAHKEFFDVLNSHQYKKSWNKEEQNEVADSFEPIRRSFK